ncbi:MAG: hypothetical protein M3R55_02415 [Acidobacteriota bacterium]|nr:hypothetical protein [Acidobacteriota bacterium]
MSETPETPGGALPGDVPAERPNTPPGTPPTVPPPTPSDPNRLTPAWARFHSCRWRSSPEDGEFCTHRDVLPYAGKEGFKPEAWCPECQYFKLKRVARKPSY